MSKDKYTEVTAKRVLEKSGVKVGDSKRLVIQKGKLGLRGLGAADFLVKHCGMVISYEA